MSTHGYTIMEQPVARDLFQSEAAGIMLVEPQQSSDNSLCSHPPWLGKGWMARLAQLCSSQDWHLPARTPTPKAGQEEHFARACDFNCFPGSTKVAAIAAPPELMRLATGDRTVRLIHCVEDKLCVCGKRLLSLSLSS